MKYLFLGLLSLLIFAGTIAGALLMTGNFNRETLDRFLQNEVAMEMDDGPAQPAEIGPVAEGLREKEQDLAAREAALDERERRLETRMQEMQALQTRIQEMQSEMDATMEDADTAKTQRIRSQAVSIAAMSPEKAAEVLQRFPADDAAAIIFAQDATGSPVIKDRDQGKILDALDSDFATQVMRAYQDMGL